MKEFSNSLMNKREVVLFSNLFLNLQKKYKWIYRLYFVHILTVHVNVVFKRVLYPVFLQGGGGSLVHIIYSDNEKTMEEEDLIILNKT